MTRNRHQPFARPSAFTLIEMSVSLTILCVIIVACGSVIVLASRVGGGGGGGASSSTSGDKSALSASVQRVTDQLAADLKTANTVSARSSTSITFSVPDRDGDNLPETITYAWTGGAGGSLTRRVNGGASASIQSNVQNFKLSFLDKTVPAPDPIESPEQVLVSYDVANPPSAQPIKASNKASEYFCPTLPGSTISWKITKFRVQIQRNGSSSSSAYFSVYAADSSKKPTGSALASGSYALTNLASGGIGWVEISVSGMTGLSPGAGYCIVATATSSSNAYYTLYSGSVASYPGAFATVTNNGPWTSPDPAKAMQFYVYGTITSQP
jgi:prepilin-type N-terminal cleavage/methylation domain-containing protein